MPGQQTTGRSSDQDRGIGVGRRDLRHDGAVDDAQAATILILTPVLMPIVKAAGIDPVYFGVLFIINNSIGLITPPVGVVLIVPARLLGG